MVPRPDLAIYLEVPIEVIMERLKKKRVRSVMESLEVQEKVRDVYMNLVKEGKLIMVDGNRPIMEVSQDIQKIVIEKLKNP